MTDLQKAKMIFGTEIRDTHSFVGLINDLDLIEIQGLGIEIFNEYNPWESKWSCAISAEKFNSQPFKREWINGKEPLFKHGWSIGDHGISIYQKGYWKTILVEFGVTTLNEVLTQCNKIITIN